MADQCTRSLRLLADGACYEIAHTGASEYGEHRCDGHTFGVDAKASDPECSSDNDERQ
jgi:hypothetical protein